MKFLASLSAIAGLSLCAAAANASITLPTNGSQVVFNGSGAVFATSVLPQDNPTNGQLLAPTGPIQLTAFGNVSTIFNAAGSLGAGNVGSIASDEQVTFGLTNAYLQVTGAFPLGSTATETKWLIQSTVTGTPTGTGGPSLTLYDKALTSTNGLNTSSYIGTNYNSVLPAAVTSDATPYLTFNNMTNVTATFEVAFNKVGSSYTTETFILESLNAAGFPVSGGSAASLFSQGISVDAQFNTGQSGLTVATSSTPKFLEADTYALIVGKTIPEPASLALLAVGGLLIGFRGRKANREV